MGVGNINNFCRPIKGFLLFPTMLQITSYLSASLLAGADAVLVRDASRLAATFGTVLHKAENRFLVRLGYRFHMP